MKFKNLISWALTFCAIFAILQYYCRFHFFYEEQFQLFLFSGSYAFDTIVQPGGLTLYLSRFLVQFFILPFVGASVSAGLITGIIYLSHRFLQSISNYKYNILLSFLPGLSFIILHSIVGMMQSTVSFFTMTLLLVLYIRINKPRLRLYIASISLPVLFLLAGPIAVLTALCLFIWEFQKRQLRWYWGMIFIIETLIVSLGSVFLGWICDFRSALLPDAYIDPLLKYNEIYYPWGIFLLSILLTTLLKKREHLFNKRPSLWIALQLILLVPACYSFIYQRKSEQTDVLEQLNYYVQTEQWNKIITCASQYKGDPQLTSYLNLALAHKGELGDKLFYHNQEGLQGLVPKWDYDTSSSMMLSDICYCMNDVAGAQKYAFEGNLACINEGCPRLLMRLVETNLIYGAYAVSEKYIQRLEHTLFYREWAKSRRKFLYNDKLIEKEPFLGNKRKSLFDASKNPTESSILTNELEQLAVNNPADQTSIQYLVAIYLVNKDLKNFKNLLEKHYGTKVWPTLSVSHQEAVFASSQDDPAYSLAHGVSYETNERFDEFQRALNNNKSSQDLQTSMSDYNDTFWYYLLFKK